MATAAKFRIDVAIHDLLMNSNPQGPAPALVKGAVLPEPVFPQFPEKLADPGPETPPDHRHWNRDEIVRKVRGWLVPYLRSRVLPGDFHPITAYLFLEYKCNIDCWYCWSFNNKVKGMTEDVARRSIDWLHDHGCRVLALMGGEPLLRPEFAHKVVYYAAKKGFWIYIGTNGRLLRPEVTDRLADAGTAIFNFALDAWDEKPSLPKALVPRAKNLEYLMRKQYVYGYMVFFNMNICRNNLEDIRRLTEFAHDHRVATDYHINETPMIEQDDHFKHLDDNPTYIRPEDWREVDALVDWMIGTEPGRLSDGQFRAPPAGNEGLHAHVLRPGPAPGRLVWRWHGADGEGDHLLASHARHRARRRRRPALHRLELPRRTKQRHRPHRRHRRSLLPHVRRHLRLGQHRQP